MQYLGRHYARYFNRKHRRSGTLFEGRFKSSLVDTGSYLLGCQRYIEMNPVRAGMRATALMHLGEPSRCGGRTPSTWRLVIPGPRAGPHIEACSQTS